MDGREELVAASGEGLGEIAVRAGEQTVRHLHQRHPAPERRVDLAQLESDVSAPDDEEPLGDIRHLEGGRGVHDPVAFERKAGRHQGKRAHRDDSMLEADHLRLIPAHPDGPRILESAAAAYDLHALGLGHGGEPPRQLAHHAIGLPFAQGIE